MVLRNLARDSPQNRVFNVCALSKSDKLNQGRNLRCIMYKLLGVIMPQMTCFDRIENNQFNLKQKVSMQ